jgi:hypothetical protein
MAYDEAARQFSFRVPEGLVVRVDRCMLGHRETGLDVTRAGVVRLLLKHAQDASSAGSIFCSVAACPSTVLAAESSLRFLRSISGAPLRSCTGAPAKSVDAFAQGTFGRT